MQSAQILFTSFALCLLCAPRFADCGQITEYAVSDRGGTDAPRDGTFDSLTAESDIEIIVQNPLSGSPAERRAAFEFSLGALPLGATITSAKLKINFTGSFGFDPPTIRVYGYSADGSVALSDMTQTSNVLSGATSTSPLIDPTIDVTAFIQSLVSSSTTHAGFLVAADLHFNSDTNLVWVATGNQTNPLNRTRLEIEYDEVVSPVPEPSSLALLSIGGLIGAVQLRRRQRGCV